MIWRMTEIIKAITISFIGRLCKCKIKHEIFEHEIFEHEIIEHEIIEHEIYENKIFELETFELRILYYKKM
jgi:hypothetical protein